MHQKKFYLPWDSWNVKKYKTKISPVRSKKNNICQNYQYRSVREIGTLARVLSYKVWLKNVILVRKRFLMVPQLESISWCLFQKIREEIAFHIGGLSDHLSILKWFWLISVPNELIHTFLRYFFIISDLGMTRMFLKTFDSDLKSPDLILLLKKVT